MEKAKISIEPPAEYISAITQYGTQAREHAAHPRKPKPNANLLTIGLSSWLRGIESAEILDLTQDPSVAVTLYQPSSSATTVRYCDPEFLYVAILHVIVGGSFFVQPNGNKKRYYWRISVYGGSAKPRRQGYALRLIVDTSKGSYTKEALEFHDLRRSRLGRVYRPLDKTNNGAKHGREDMINWSVAHFEEATGWKHFRSAEEYRKLLLEGYAWLEKIALGSADQSSMDDAMKYRS